MPKGKFSQDGIVPLRGVVRTGRLAGLLDHEGNEFWGVPATLRVGDQAAAADNLGAIQAAANRGGIVPIAPAGDVYVSGPVRLPDNTTLYVGPTTRFKLADGSGTCNMVLNANYDVTSAAVAITAAGLVATISWAGHGKTVGDWIGVQGAIQSAYNGIWKVATVADANTLTVTLDEVPTASPATGSPVARLGNVGCGLIVDGVMDANEANQVLADSNVRHGAIFYNVAKPVLGGRFINVRKYAALCANVRDAEVRPMSFQTASDGLHFQGVIGASIQSLQGYCGDDMLAFTCGDYAQYELFRGLVDGINVGRIHGENSLKNAIKVSGGAYRTRNIRAELISGRFQGSIVGVIEDVNLSATYLESLSIGTLSASWNSALNAVQCTSTTTGCTIDSVVIDHLNATLSGTQGVIAAGGATGVIRRATIGSCNVDGAGLSGAGALFKAASPGLIGTAELHNWRVAGSTNMYGILQDGGLNRAYITEGEWAGGGFLARVNSGATTTPDIFLSGAVTGNTNNPIDLRKSANLYTKGWKHNGSTAVNINGAGTVNWVGDIVSANTHLAIAGGMTVNVNGATIKADVTAIARLDGAQVYNTNAAAGTLGAAGPVVCQGAAANSWKLLANSALSY
jgi:hypothetical protein